MKIRSALPLVIVAISAVGCGGESAQVKSAKTEAKAPPPKPRCPPDADPQPPDAQSKMTGLQAGIRQCFALGTNSKTDVATVSLHLTVAESGSVQQVDVQADGAQPAATDCIEKLARATTFSKFCGDAALIAWTYTVN